YLIDLNLQGINRFTQLADDSEEVPNLQGKTYSAFKLTQHEWLKLELIRDVLQTWESMAGTSKFDSLSTSITSGLDNVSKWYRKTNNTDVYFVCLALDPNYKVAYAKAKWASQDFDDGMRRLEDVVSSWVSQ
ncbi:hypothetical protein P692DRAFT_20731536, partial [Suillus brevipes Sb2]